MGIKRFLIPNNDEDRAQTFYEKVFGWNTVSFL